MIIFTDCVPDRNAGPRLAARCKKLGYGVPHLEGVEGTPEGLQAAAASLVETLLAATEGLWGELTEDQLVVLLNVAQRGTGLPGNGVTFGSFYTPAGDLVVTTLNPEVLAAVGAAGLIAGEVWEYDIETVISWYQSVNPTVTDAEVRALRDTQFRSLWFQTLVPSLLKRYGAQVPHTVYGCPPADEPSGCVRYVDRFGNLRSGARRIDILVDGELPSVIKLADGRTVPLVERLTDVPHGTLAAVIGSGSLFDGWVTVVVNGLDCSSAAEVLGLCAGDELLAWPQPTR